MQPGMRLVVQLVSQADELQNLSDVSVDVVFFVNGRQRYRFDAGETNQNGKLLIGYEQLERKRAENQKFALMDYNTPLTSCDEKVDIVIPSIADFRSRLDAVKKWFPEGATHLTKRLERSKNGEIAAAPVSVTLKPSGKTTVVIGCVLVQKEE